MTWISVKDKLPEPNTDTRVLVYDLRDGVKTAEYRTRYKKPYWYAGLDPDEFEIILDSVTHWQPLPEPPEA